MGSGSVRDRLFEGPHDACLNRAHSDNYWLPLFANGEVVDDPGAQVKVGNVVSIASTPLPAKVIRFFIALLYLATLVGLCWLGYQAFSIGKEAVFSNAAIKHDEIAKLSDDHRTVFQRYSTPGRKFHLHGTVTKLTDSGFVLQVPSSQNARFTFRSKQINASKFGQSTGKEICLCASVSEVGRQSVNLKDEAFKVYIEESEMFKLFDGVVDESDENVQSRLRSVFEHKIGIAKVAGSFIKPDSYSTVREIEDTGWSFGIFSAKKQTVADGLEREVEGRITVGKNSLFLSDATMVARDSGGKVVHSLHACDTKQFVP